MKLNSIYKGMIQAKFNEKASNVIYGEILIIAAHMGFYYNSWYIFAGMFIGLIICMSIPVIKILMSLVFSSIWALIGATIVSTFQGIDLSNPSNFLEFFDFFSSVFTTPASQVIGGFIFFIGVSVHLDAIKWNRD